MTLANWGQRVEKILANPPKTLSPGEQVSQWVAENDPMASGELPFEEVVARKIHLWLKSRLRAEGAALIQVLWSEQSRGYNIQVRFHRKHPNGERFSVVGSASVWEEQVLQNSEDKLTWEALLEYVATDIMWDADLVGQGEFNAAAKKLNTVAQKAADRRQVEAEREAIDSIMRSARLES